MLQDRIDLLSRAKVPHVPFLSREPEIEQLDDDRPDWTGSPRLLCHALFLSLKTQLAHFDPKVMFRKRQNKASPLRVETAIVCDEVFPELP